MPLLVVTAEATHKNIIAAVPVGADGDSVNAFNAVMLKEKRDKIMLKKNVSAA